MNSIIKIYCLFFLLVLVGCQKDPLANKGEASSKVKIKVLGMQDFTSGNATNNTIKKASLNAKKANAGKFMVASVEKDASINNKIAQNSRIEMTPQANIRVVIVRQKDSLVMSNSLIKVGATIESFLDVTLSSGDVYDVYSFTYNNTTDPLDDPVNQGFDDYLATEVYTHETKKVIAEFITVESLLNKPLMTAHDVIDGSDFTEDGIEVDLLFNQTTARFKFGLLLESGTYGSRYKEPWLTYSQDPSGANSEELTGKLPKNHAHPFIHISPQGRENIKVHFGKISPYEAEWREFLNPFETDAGLYVGIYDFRVMDYFEIKTYEKSGISINSFIYNMNPEATTLYGLDSSPLGGRGFAYSFDDRILQSINIPGETPYGEHIRNFQNTLVTNDYFYIPTKKNVNKNFIRMDVDFNDLPINAEVLDGYKEYLEPYPLIRHRYINYTAEHSNFLPGSSFIFMGRYDETVE